MKTPERFTKVSDQLIALGVRPRLAMLYGRLVFHAKSGACFPKHTTLAAEIGLTCREHLLRMLKQLQRLRLVEWGRGQYGNSYRVLSPDVTFLSHLKTAPDVTSDVTSDVTFPSHLKPAPDVTSKSRQMCAPSHICGSVTINEKNIEKKEAGILPPPDPVREYAKNGQPAAAAQPEKWESFAALYPPQKLNHAKAKIEWGALTASQQAAAIVWLERNRGCPQWLVDHGQYIPLASNFLKRREFESPPPPVIERKGPQSHIEKLEQKHNIGVAMMKFQRGEKP